jgi:hypothetical protein
MLAQPAASWAHWDWARLRISGAGRTAFGGGWAGSAQFVRLGQSFEHGLRSVSDSYQVIQTRTAARAAV